MTFRIRLPALVLPTAHRALRTIRILLPAASSQLPALLLSACASGPPQPATLDPANDTCRHCRMAVSDRRFASQIVASGEEPAFFDDLGCLRDHLRERDGLAAGAVVFVTDHRTGEWVEGHAAVYTRQPALATPMASGLIAHRDAASRDQDRATHGGAPVPAAEILGGARDAGGRQP